MRIYTATETNIFGCASRLLRARQFALLAMQMMITLQGRLDRNKTLLKNCIDPGFHRLLCVSILGLACDNFEHRLVIKPRLMKLICRQ
jgi:hypothetical protein